MKQATFIKTRDKSTIFTNLVSRQWRRSHLAVAAGVSLCLVVSLFLLPSGNVEAKRSSATTIKSLELSFQGEPLPESEAAPLSTKAPTKVPTNVSINAPTNLPINDYDDVATELEPPYALNWREQKIRNGDNLTTVFNREGLNARHVHEVASSSKLAKKLTRMIPGQKLAFGFDDKGELVKLNYIVSQLESYQFIKTEDSFTAEHVVKQPEVLTAFRQGTIESSLFLSAESAGLSHRLIMDLANVFGWDIDFALDIRKGDHFSVLFEEKFLDGEKISTGNILAASFTNQGETFRTVRYTDSKGHSHYYTPEGLSMRKAFLRAPLDFTRVSSGFNPRRLHPVFKTMRPHRGVDYAAPRGTPVYSAGDGKVIKAGYSKANGNFIFIQHGQQYVTKYLHLNNKKVKQGQRVSQRQLIGTVGSTGYATGPHLHYEFLVNGVHRNPRTVKLPQAKPIADSERDNFMRTTSPLIALLDSKGTEQYALANP